MNCSLEGSGALEVMRDMVIAEEELAGDHDDSVDEDDLPDPTLDPNYVHVRLAEGEHMLWRLI